MRNDTRGHRLPALQIMPVAMVVAVVAIGVALGAGMAVAATATGAKIEATQFNARAFICDEFLCESFYPTTEAYAKCPAGKRALGGGVVQSGQPDRLRVAASGPLDATGFTSKTRDGDVATQWYAAVNNEGFRGITRTFRVFAICSGTSQATIEATALEVNPYTGDDVGEASAKCSSGKRALGGGVVQSGPAETVRVYGGSGPLDATGVTLETTDGDVAKQWYAAVSHSDHINQQRLFKVFAICE